jgi:hypothetical protein
MQLSIANFSKPSSIYNNFTFLNETRPTRPVQRNGFTLTQTDTGWILFGGDRHRLTINDLWYLNPKSLEIAKFL